MIMYHLYDCMNIFAFFKIKDGTPRGTCTIVTHVTIRMDERHG